MIDSKALYRWAFRTFTLKSIVDMEKPLAEVNLNLAWERTLSCWFRKRMSPPCFLMTWI